MIKLINQTTEYYCTTEDEAEKVLLERKEHSVGKVVKHTTEDKKEYVKLIIKEEYNVATELAKEDTQDTNDYYELLEEGAEF